MVSELCPTIDCTMPLSPSGGCEAHPLRVPTEEAGRPGRRVIFQSEYVDERGHRIVLTQWSDGDYSRSEYPL